MIRAVIFDMFETLITHYQCPLYWGSHMAADAGISEERFQQLWRPSEYDRSMRMLPPSAPGNHSHAFSDKGKRDFDWTAQ